MREVLVLAGGEPPGTARVEVWRRWLEAAPPTRVIAADGGLALAAPLQVHVDLVVGDLDSVTGSDLAVAEGAGARVERHPVAKDATDLALALDAALATGAERVTVVGGGGGRADHELALWLLLAAPAYGEVEVRAWSPRATTEVVHPGRVCTLGGTPGEVCTVVPVHGDAHGVTTSGLRYPLRGETLPAGTSRGVSNEVVARHATVSVERGTLLVVRPVRPRGTGPAV